MIALHAVAAYGPMWAAWASLGTGFLGAAVAGARWASAGLRAMLAVESVLMAGVSALLGVGLGTLYAWFGVKTLTGEIFENAANLTMPWQQVGLILVVAAAAGLAACVLPARRAARIAPAAGLVAD